MRNVLKKMRNVRCTSPHLTAQILITLARIDHIAAHLFITAHLLLVIVQAGNTGTAAVVTATKFKSSKFSKFKFPKFKFSKFKPTSVIHSEK